MTSYCRICAGPIVPPDSHGHCIACLGLAHTEAALEESDCAHCADLPMRVLRTRRNVARGLFGVRPTAARAPLPHPRVEATIWREATVLNGRLDPQSPSPMIVSVPLRPSRTLFPSARKARRTLCPFQPQRRRTGRNRSGIALTAKDLRTSKRSS